MAGDKAIKQIKQKFMNREYCDMTIKYKNDLDEESEYKAHRMILSQFGYINTSHEVFTLDLYIKDLSYVFDTLYKLVLDRMGKATIEQYIILIDGFEKLNATNIVMKQLLVEMFHNLDESNDQLDKLIIESQIITKEQKIFYCRVLMCKPIDQSFNDVSNLQNETIQYYSNKTYYDNDTKELIISGEGITNSFKKGFKRFIHDGIKYELNTTHDHISDEYGFWLTSKPESEIDNEADEKNNEKIHNAHIRFILYNKDHMTVLDVEPSKDAHFFDSEDIVDYKKDDEQQNEEKIIYQIPNTIDYDVFSRKNKRTRYGVITNCPALGCKFEFRIKMSD